MLMDAKDMARWSRDLEQVIAYGKRNPLRDFVDECKEAIDQGKRTPDPKGDAFLRGLLVRAEAALAAVK